MRYDCVAFVIFCLLLEICKIDLKMKTSFSSPSSSLSLQSTTKTTRPEYRKPAGPPDRIASAAKNRSNHYQGNTSKPLSSSTNSIAGRPRVTSFQNTSCQDYYPPHSEVGARCRCSPLADHPDILMRSVISSPAPIRSTLVVDCTRQGFSHLPTFVVSADSVVDGFQSSAFSGAPVAAYSHVVVDLSLNLIKTFPETASIPVNVDTLIISNPAFYSYGVNEKHWTMTSESTSHVLSSSRSNLLPRPSGRNKSLPTTKKAVDADRSHYNSMRIDTFEVSLEFSRLRHLDLSHNDLSDVPVHSLHNATSIMTINLGYNRISRLPPYSFGFLDRLVFLDLSGNKISEIQIQAFDPNPEAYAGPLLLSSLDLSYNQLTALHSGVFSYLTNLRSLHLQGNKLCDLTDTSIWNGLAKLSYLDLDFNRIQQISFDTPCFKRIANLSLNGNLLRNLKPCQFSRLKSLKSLQLSANQFQDINHCAFHNISGTLTSISLENNMRLTDFNSCSLFYLPHSRTVSFTGSGKDCDCLFYSFTHFEPYPMRFDGRECQRYANVGKVKWLDRTQVLKLHPESFCDSFHRSHVQQCSNVDCDLMCEDPDTYSVSKLPVVKATGLSTRAVVRTHGKEKQGWQVPCVHLFTLVVVCIFFLIDEFP